jgi:hypothetical protein
VTVVTASTRIKRREAVRMAAISVNVTTAGQQVTAVASIASTLPTLPLLKRITGPEAARNE